MNFKDLEKGDVFSYCGSRYLRIKEDFDGNNVINLDRDCDLYCFGGEYKVRLIGKIKKLI